MKILFDENKDPLTMDEMCDMVGEPVYLSYCVGYGEYVLINKNFTDDIEITYKGGQIGSVKYEMEKGNEFYRILPEEV